MRMLKLAAAFVLLLSLAFGQSHIKRTTQGVLEASGPVRTIFIAGQIAVD